MNGKLTKWDLDTIAERQVYIRAEEQHLAAMRSIQTAGISLARDGGATWEQLAHAVGSSPQGVRERVMKWRAQQDTAGTDATSE